MKSIWMAIATFCKTGYLPIAPGSWASLITAAVLFPAAIVFKPSSRLWLPLATLPIIIIGVIAADRAEKLMGSKDPRPIVIDEVAGQMVTLWWAPISLPVYLAGFILFRIFDIFKPFPVNLVDRKVAGGWGIMLDDVLAGIYAAGVLQLIVHLCPRLA